jgi:CheY-like chemotaxis protein
LTNLCINARDAIVDVGEITIDVSNVTVTEDACAKHAGWSPGDYVRLAVRDDGSGMTQETQAHLFEPFFTTKGVGKGTGLGLPTIHGIVEQNRGFIHVVSEPGTGTTFEIYLPRSVGEPQPTAAPVERRVGRATETILLVEDEPALLTIATRLLEQAGYIVLATSSPKEALRIAAEHSGAIHLLLTDVIMPEMNGPDLAKALRSRFQGLEELFMSGHTADAFAGHDMVDEDVNFIAKPFSGEVLTAKVRALLDEGRRRVGDRSDDPHRSQS